MRVSEVIKILKKNNCRLVRHGDSHDLLHSPITNMEFTVPRHKSKELPVKTANAIMKAAGIKRSKK